MIDLHIHSTASDGSSTPLEIIEKAMATPKLDAIAITDHDTIDGVKQVIEKGVPPSLAFLTGIEISALPLQGFEGSGSFHILGYGFSLHDKTLNTTLTRLKQARAGRTPRIIEKLNTLGCSIRLEDVEQMCGQGQIGRPHIAAAMVKKGFVGSFEEAFDRYLKAGKPAYVDKFRLSCREAIELITAAGGIPVLAHPGLITPNSREAMTQLVDQLVAMGLEGIEVYYTDHSRDQTAFLADLAEKKGILATGGSDYHGTLKQGTEIGTGTGNLAVDSALFTRLLLALETRRSHSPATGRLEENIGYHFKDSSLLTTALCHSSFANEHPEEDMHDNQRLEFLGDAVLGLCIGEMLMEAYPEINEGDLSKLRASLVSEAGLVAMAKNIDLGRFVLLGRGERLTRGHEKDSILADTFEALMAAVYLDSDFKTTYDLINTHFHERITSVFQGSKAEDYKSSLQEHVQEAGHEAPSYTITKESGPDHAKIFEILVTVGNISTSGSGKNKKAAEQNAAKKALDALKNRPV